MAKIYRHHNYKIRTSNPNKIRITHNIQFGVETKIENQTKVENQNKEKS